MRTTLLSLRLARPELKLLYLVAVWSAGLPVVWAIPSVPVLDEVVGGVFIAISLIGLWYATRVFRGRGEPVGPPRAWWRWTAWPTASWWLAVFFMGGLSTLIIRLVQITGMDQTSTADIVWGVVLAAWQGVVAFGFLNSAIRLTAAGVRMPRPTPYPRGGLLTPPKLD